MGAKKKKKEKASKLPSSRASKLEEKKKKAAPPAPAPPPPPPPELELFEEVAAKPSKPQRRATAEAMGAKQREISVSEFFTKNRHLLGFDNPAKALLTTVKEAVDNALDACEEAGILPDLVIEIQELAETRFRVVIEDNGPGIVKPQIPKIFAKLLYGSKFHRLRQSLTAEQSVVVERDGRCERIPIGAFVDSHTVGEGEAVVDVSHLKMRVPAFDPRTLRYEWRSLSHVIRHERHNEVLEVRTQQGKRVRVTGCHSLFGYDSATRTVRAVEARSLKAGDYIVAPRRVPAASRATSVNLLDAMREDQLAARWAYVYRVPDAVITRLEARAKAIHDKRDGRARRYYRFADVYGGFVDVLDDSFNQYSEKRFLPAWLVKRLGLEHACCSSVLRTYHHGVPCEVPITWTLDADVMRFLGLYVAEGHSDRRQIAFTFAEHERTTHAAEIERTARRLGLRTTLEERDRHAIRVKVFGGLLDLVLPEWCGRGAKNKRIPSFVFGADRDARQHFLDALHQGDGHRFKRGDALVLVSVSERLAADVELLWLMQGVVAARRPPVTQKGLGRQTSVTHCVHVFGSDIAASRVYERHAQREQQNRYAMMPAQLLAAGAEGAEGTRVATTAEGIVRSLGLGLGPAGPSKALSIIQCAEPGRSYDVGALAQMTGQRVTRHLTKHMAQLGYLEEKDGSYVATPKVLELRRLIAHVGSLASSDVCFLRVEEIKRVDDANPYVYDLSVPGCENFVAGDGLLACHNSRGQQGIGISAAGLYAQLTTGKPVVITSKTGKGRPAFKIDLRIDTKRNQPDVVKDETVEWDKDHGTRVEMELTAAYRGGRTGVQEYIEQTVVANPHLELEYRPPKGEPMLFPRVTQELPREADEIKPHPHGVELGMFMAMLQDSPKSTVKMVLQADFSRVGPTIADEICTRAGVPTKKKANDLDHTEIERLHKALSEVKVKAPPSSCVVPIGEELLIEGLKRRFPLADFYVSTTRPPSVYRGNPFVVEVGLAWGGQLPAEEPAEIMRFANRVPLQYQPKACAISESVYDTNWRLYELQQPKGSLPIGPIAMAVHLASVWVPFTSEAKEAVAHYDELLREMKLALQECGRRLATHLRARERAVAEHRRLSLFQRYIPEVAAAMGAILESEPKKIEKSFFTTLPKFVKVDLDANGTASVPPPVLPTKEDKPAALPAGKPGKKGARKKKSEASEQLSLLGD
jgi:DNA topoisomerase-6 subunit B